MQDFVHQPYDLLVGYHGEPKVNLIHNIQDYIGTTPKG